MKDAQSFLIDFTNMVGLPVSGTVVLLEREPDNSNDPNWVVTGGGASDHENAKAVADMRKLHPRIDWSGVKECDGKWRIIMAVKTA
jgi:hypothetical protein